MRALFTALAILLFFSPLAKAEEDVALHSDLPLDPGSGDDRIWPKHVSDPTGFGFAMPFASGDWKRSQTDCGNCESWVALNVASVFDGGLTWSEADTESGLRGSGEPAVVIAFADDLYAIEIGMRGGSRYLLVSPEREPDKLIKRLKILDVRCLETPQAHTKKSAANHFIFRTDYCDVESLDALEHIGRDALVRPPVATLQWMSEEPKP